MTLIAALAISAASATTPADKYGECIDTSKTQNYTMQDYDGNRTIWAPGLFCKGKTALLSMQSGILTVNPDGSGSFDGTAKVVSGGCGKFDNTEWDVSYEVDGTDPKYWKKPNPPAGFPYQLGILKNGVATYGSYTLTFDNYPNNNDYGHQVGVRGNVKDDDLGGAVWFDWWLKKDGCLLRDGHGDFNFDLECIPPQNDCPIDGDLAGGYNVHTCGDFTASGSDIQGKAAIGGTMDVSGYGIGSGLGAPAGTVLAVGGDLHGTSSQVYAGDAEVDGHCYTDESFGTPSGSLSCYTDTYEASAACDGLCAAADYLAGEDNSNCWITAQNWGAIEISTSGDAICNLDLDAADAAFASWVQNINGITVSGDSGATVVINVKSAHGNHIWGKNGSFNLQGGITAHDILWNFGCNDYCPDSLGSVNIKGSLLAPSCDMEFNNGSIDGQYVVGSHKGNGQFHDYRFKGEVCPTDDDGNGDGKGDHGDYDQ